VGFEQAAIPVEKEKEFNELRGAIARVFAPERVEKFLATLKGKGVRIRDLDSVLAKRVLESVDAELKRSGTRAQALYEALTLSDKGQMREFYLGRVEQAPSELRRKFHQVYRDS
jgi:uncharacterized ParB-like nuclease family protein